MPHTNSARTQPDWAVYLQENRGMAIMGFFMGNIIVGNLVQTGAFEIYLGPDLIHSKIATGVLPDINWLIREVNIRVYQMLDVHASTTYLFSCLFRAYVCGRTRL